MAEQNVTIYTPAGRVGTPPATQAKAVSSLDGKRIGILDNRKPNAGVLLGRLADRLVADHGATLVLIEEKNAAISAPDQVLGKLTKEVELVLTGSAD